MQSVAVPGGRKRPDPALVAADIWREAEAQRVAAEHKTLATQRMQFASRGNPDHVAIERADRVYHATWEVHWVALSRLYTTRPATLDGAIEILAVMLESDDGQLAHPDIVTGIENVVACLKALPDLPAEVR